jgi:hypothetical protein
MKHSYIYTIQLFSVLLFSTVGLNAQEYHPFPTKNSVWAENYFPGDGYPYCSFYYFALKNNDTIINEHQYHKLYFSCDTNFTEDKFCGALREENKRIYYYSIDSLNCSYMPVPLDTEIVLYDFNLKLGDTITSGKFRVGYPGYIIVNAIDSTLIDQEYRKVFSFGYNGGIISDAKWIEGIGCVRGLFADVGYVGWWTKRLICCIIDNNVIYHHGYENEDCYYYLHSENLQLLDNNLKIKIIPNPAGSSTRIEFEKPEYQKLVISDQSGKKLKEFNLKGKQSIVIDKGELPGGLYLLSVYDKIGNIQTQKIIFK